MSLIKESYLFERAALGLLNGCKQVILTGNNPGITTTNETVYNVSGLYVKLTTAVAFEAISSSANDASPSGSGVRTVSVDLVDGNGAETTVTVTMNGTNAVAITGTYVACNDIRIATTGSGLVNAGDIDIRTVSGSTVQARMPGGNGRNLGFIYTVPANKKALLRNAWFGATGATGEITFVISTSDSSGITRTEVEHKAGFSFTSLTNAQGVLNLGAGLLIPAQSMVHALARASAGAGSLSAVGELYVFDGATNILGL